jgi:hypothetical protein
MEYYINDSEIAEAIEVNAPAWCDSFFSVTRDEESESIIVNADYVLLQVWRDGHDFCWDDGVGDNPVTMSGSVDIRAYGSELTDTIRGLWNQITKTIEKRLEASL